jgi:2-oxoisovalerate dehydrogenase E2 component (dihydrolipoyl transacylase)
MAREIKMPQLGESVTEGTVSRWLKEIGDTVEKYEPLLEVITDKVDTEITAEVSGVVLDIKVEPGQTVDVGTVLAIVGHDGEELDEAEEAAADRDVQPEVTTGEYDEAKARAAADETAEPQDRADGKVPSKPTGKARISPVVGRIAAEHNVDIQDVPGTGRGGRVTKQDILQYIDERKAEEPSAKPPTRRETPAKTRHPAVVPGELLELTPMRRSIAEHMLESKRTAPHVTTVWEVDMSAVERYRQTHRAAFEQREGVNLSYLPFVIAATVEALKEHPIVNSEYTDDGIRVKQEINIGVAVALDRGLIVPVVRNAGDKSLAGIAKAVSDLATRARSSQLSPDEVQNATFSVTNYGALGSLIGTPIIPRGQAAILGVGAVQKRPVVVQADGLDLLAIKPMMYLALSFDHRVLDGGTADPFMADLKHRLENFQR